MMSRESQSDLSDYKNNSDKDTLCVVVLTVEYIIY